MSFYNCVLRLYVIIGWIAMEFDANSHGPLSLDDFGHPPVFHEQSKLSLFQ